MTIPTSVLATMATLGLSVEQAKAVAAMLSDVEAATRSEATADVEAGREKARARWHRWKNKQDTNASKRLPTAANNSREGDARGEVKTSNLDTNTEEKKETPRAALMAVLDETHAAAVVEHRQRIRKPLTAYAAAKLAAKFAACQDPNAAADKMIGNGWQGFEPEWMNRPDARGSPLSKPLSAQEILMARRQVKPDDDRPPNRPVLIASR